MPATITGITTSWAVDSSVLIDGSGFGASQGGSVLVFYCDQADSVEVVPTSWSDTQIAAAVPTTAVVGAIGWFAVQLEGEGAGAVTDRGTIGADTTPPAEWPSGTILWAKPGSTEAPVDDGGGEPIWEI